MEDESARSDRVGQNAVVEEDGKIGREGIADGAAPGQRLHGVHELPFAKRVIAEIGPQDFRFAAPFALRVDGQRNHSVRRADAVQRLLVAEMRPANARDQVFDHFVVGQGIERRQRGRSPGSVIRCIRRPNPW